MPWICARSMPTASIRPTVSSAKSLVEPVRTISTSSAAIVEAENLEVLRKMFDLTHPGPRVTGKPPNMDERRALTVNLVIHIDVVDANLGACSPPSAGLRFETIG